MRFLVFLLALPMFAQQASLDIREARSRRDESRATLRADSNLILVPVLVTDAFNRPVLGLVKESFHLTDDKEERKIVNFFTEEGPVSMGIILDTSGSMTRRLSEAVASLDHVLDASSDGDEFFLTRYAHNRVELVCKFTRDVDEIRKFAAASVAGGWTPLLDSIYSSLQKMRHAHNIRRVLLILSDGNDNDSRFSLEEVVAFAKEVDVAIYAVSIGGGNDELATIAEQTGGRQIVVPKLRELPETVQNMNRLIRSRYVLGFYSSKRDELYHKLALKVEQPTQIKWTVSWRRGYYSR